MSLKQIIIDYFETGVSDQNSDERNRQVFIVNLFSFVGMSVTAIMAIQAFFGQDTLLTIALFTSSAIFFSGFYLQKKIHNYFISSAIILYSLFLLMIFLVYAGGVNNTGPLWIFMIAPVAFYIHGFKVGLIDIAVFIAIISLLMFYPDNQLLATTYSTEFKLRLIYSFLTITFLSGFYEYSRQSTYDNLLEITSQYKQLAKLDPLTQLSNRRDALSKLEYESQRSLRNKESIALLLCDVDHFKSINDRYGHEGGDRVLIDIAKLFESGIRRQDTVARWGGEEFLFILPQTDAKQAAVCAKNIHKKLANQPFSYQQHSFNITISIGLADIKPDENIHDAIKKADYYLYQAKKNGRNQTFPNLT